MHGGRGKRGAYPFETESRKNNKPRKKKGWCSIASNRLNPLKAKKQEVTWDIGTPNEKQLQAFKADTLFVGYGGAKGGGKTWFIQHKAVGGAMQWPGIKILILRAHYPELEQNHVNPIKTLVAPLGITSYNGSTHLMTFDLGDDKPSSYIQFGHWDGDEAENEYNGLEFDWMNGTSSINRVNCWKPKHASAWQSAAKARKPIQYAQGSTTNEWGRQPIISTRVPGAHAMI